VLTNNQILLPGQLPFIPVVADNLTSYLIVL